MKLIEIKENSIKTKHYLVEDNKGYAVVVDIGLENSVVYGTIIGSDLRKRLVETLRDKYGKDLIDKTTYLAKNQNKDIAQLEKTIEKIKEKGKVIK